VFSEARRELKRLGNMRKIRNSPVGKTIVVMKNFREAGEEA
jgi:hypothetical protein